MRITYIDFDGVIFQNKEAANRVGTRCSQFFNKTVGIDNEKYQGSISNKMYQTFGHTVYALKKLGYEACSDQFNTHVYKNVDPKKLVGDVDDNTRKTMKEWYNVMTELDNVLIYTDAPHDWIKMVNETYSLELPDHVRVISSQDLGYYKCQWEAYTMLPGGVLIDDSLRNISTASEYETWKPVIFGQGLHSFTGDKVSMISSPNQVIALN